MRGARQKKVASPMSSESVCNFATATSRAFVLLRHLMSGFLSEPQSDPVVNAAHLSQGAETATPRAYHSRCALPRRSVSYLICHWGSRLGNVRQVQAKTIYIQPNVQSTFKALCFTPRTVGAHHRHSCAHIGIHRTFKQIYGDAHEEKENNTDDGDESS